jgi:hypothetical protein
MEAPNLMNLTLPTGGKSFHPHPIIQAAGLGPGDQRALRELQNRGQGLRSRSWNDGVFDGNEYRSLLPTSPNFPDDDGHAPVVLGTQIRG